MATENEVLSKLGLTPEQIVGYVYAGMFIAFAVVAVDAPFVKEAVKSLGGLLSTMVVLSLGVGAFVFYRRIIGEFVLYHAHHAVHRTLDLVLGRKGHALTSCTAYLAFKGVPLGSRRAAYTAIREVFFDKHARRRLDLAHGEIHVLYLTAIGCFAVTLYLLFDHAGGLTNNAWPSVGALSYLGALWADIQQHSVETQMLKVLDEAKLRSFLEGGGYLHQGTKQKA